VQKTKNPFTGSERTNPKRGRGLQVVAEAEETLEVSERRKKLKRSSDFKLRRV
jgi:hypothetical protein